MYIVTIYDIRVLCKNQTTRTQFPMTHRPVYGNYVLTSISACVPIAPRPQNPRDGWLEREVDGDTVTEYMRVRRDGPRMPGAWILHTTRSYIDPIWNTLLQDAYKMDIPSMTRSPLPQEDGRGYRVVVRVDGDERDRGRVGVILACILFDHAEHIDQGRIHWVGSNLAAMYNHVLRSVDGSGLHVKLAWGRRQQLCDNCYLPTRNKASRFGRCARCHDSAFYRFKSGEYVGLSYKAGISRGIAPESVPDDERAAYSHIRAHSCAHCLQFDPQLTCPSGLCDMCFSGGVYTLKSGIYSGRSPIEGILEYDAADCTPEEKGVVQRAKECVTAARAHANDPNVTYYLEVPRDEWRTTRRAQNYKVVATCLTLQCLESGTKQDVRIARSDGFVEDV